MALRCVLHRSGRLWIPAAFWATPVDLVPLPRLHRPEGEPGTEPKTFPEQLDAAKTGQEFATVLGGLFAALEKAMEAEGCDDE